MVPDSISKSQLGYAVKDLGLFEFDPNEKLFMIGSVKLMGL